LSENDKRIRDGMDTHSWDAGVAVISAAPRATTLEKTKGPQRSEHSIDKACDNQPLGRS